MIISKKSFWRRFVVFLLFYHQNLSFCRKPGNLEQRLWTTHRFLSISRQVVVFVKINTLIVRLFFICSVCLVSPDVFLTFFLTFFWRSGLRLPSRDQLRHLCREIWKPQRGNHSLSTDKRYTIIRINENYSTFLILPTIWILSYDRLYRLARRSRATIQRWTPGSSSPIMTSKFGSTSNPNSIMTRRDWSTIF